MIPPDTSQCYFCKYPLMYWDDEYKREWMCDNCRWTEDTDVSKYRITHYIYDHDIRDIAWLLCVVLDKFYITMNYHAQETIINTLRGPMKNPFLTLQFIPDWKDPAFLEKIKLYNLLS